MDFYETLLDDIEKNEGLWKRTERSKSLTRSNSAHSRLEDKHIRDGNYDLMRYHNLVYSEQSKKNRILSLSERKSIYKTCVKQQSPAPRVKGKGRKDER